MTIATSSLEQALRRVLSPSTQITQRTSLAGGSINHSERLDTTEGVFVMKSGGPPAPGFYRAEAMGLAALRASGCPLTVPRVIVCEESSPSFLVIEFLAAGARQDDFDEQVGHGLAALHKTTTDRFGFTEDNYCGATRQPNAWRAEWVDFYAQARLGWQLDLAVTAEMLTPSEAGRVTRLIERLGSWIGEPADGPALVHGDLWAGNLHTDSAGRPALIDPAVYHADREAELGMMVLFGGFSARTFDAYDDAFPLDPGWRERNPLYQLYHLMNHLNLFGSSYRRQVMAVVDRFV